MNIDEQNPKDGAPHSENKDGGQNRPTILDSAKIAGSANSQGDTDEDTRVRAGVEPGDEGERRGDEDGEA
ncbi:hypothetical protein EON81_12710 [bacterium]|nr:MAG: hypothetical protein EON81_12710 [bacterium]